jgi:transposase InsO family protein
VRIPAKRTIHAVLHRHGLVKGIRRPRSRATGTALSAGEAPNDLWCADFKGEFKLGNGPYCYPLTVTDTVATPINMRRRKQRPVVLAFECTHIQVALNVNGNDRTRCPVAANTAFTSAGASGVTPVSPTAPHG